MTTTHTKQELKNYYFTSESVSEGHPDKVCDRISDTILDLYLDQEPEARVACETLVTKDYVVLAGEMRGGKNITPDQIEQAIRSAIKDIGYDQDGFDYKTVKIENKLHKQSTDIEAGVDIGSGLDKEEGAGDQGLMFGYACHETESYMPAAIHYSHRILQTLAQKRKSGEITGLGPDAKTQVTIRYEDDKPASVQALVLSTQHDEDLSLEDVRARVIPIIESVLPQGWMPKEKNIHINPTGRFVIGGPVGDAGLTGRKIIVDTYGGSAPHGGGAFSGKDPTKVDRSAAYAARYLAKNVVAAGLADECTVQLAYAIGVSKPISIYLNTHGTGTVAEDKIVESLSELVNLTPKGIRTHLNLNKPIYARTSAYGHFGRTPTEDGGFSWERTDLVDELKKRLGQ